MPVWVLDRFLRSENRGIHPERGVSVALPLKIRVSCEPSRGSEAPEDQRWSGEGLRCFDALAVVSLSGAAVVLLLRKRTRTGDFHGDVGRRRICPSVQSPKKGFPLCCEVHTCGTESPRRPFVRLLPLYHLPPSSTPSNTYGLRERRERETERAKGRRVILQLA